MICMLVGKNTTLMVEKILHLSRILITKFFKQIYCKMGIL